MKFLKGESKRKGFKYVGVTVPPRIYEYMTLYVVTNDTSKSKLFQAMIEEWMAKQREVEPDELLVKKLIEAINKRKETAELPPEEFKEIITTELTQSGLKNSYIELILSEIV
jgi:hypothetical protein